MESTARSLRSLGLLTALPSSLPAAPSGCVITACDVYAMPGTVTAGTSGPIDVWGFTFSPTLGSGELGGSVNNTIIMTEGETLTLQVHNCLPTGAGDLFVEIPAAAGPPPTIGAPDTDPTCTSGAFTTQTFGADPLHPLAPGTYVYQAGSTVEQPRRLAMGLAAIIIVRPADGAVGRATAAFERCLTTKPWW